MKRLKSLGIFVCAVGAIVISATAADARPDVVLHLSGAIVEKAPGGAEKLVPLDPATKLKTGQVVLFTILAVNKGSDAALHLTPVGKVPAGTAYVSGSATATAGQLEFSVDGGKTWSTKPSVTARTQTGPVTKTADPSTFTSIRWIATKPLAPKGSARFSYEVRVK